MPHRPGEIHDAPMVAYHHDRCIDRRVGLCRRPTSARSGAEESGKKQAGPGPGADAGSLRGIGWWPLHRSGTAKAGAHDAVVKGGVQWTDGPGGGAPSTR